MQSLRTPFVACARRAVRAPASQRVAPLYRDVPNAILRPVTLVPRRAFTLSVRRTALSKPLSLPKWLQENSHLLRPPINNYCVYNDDVTVMIVGGPNERTDYHINETPEWFFQYKGSMLLKTVDPESNKFQDIPIHEGEMFLLPPNTPHNPVRFANTVGIVLEQHRSENSIDKLRWYCQSCGEQVHEDSFHCTDLGTQIKAAVQKFEADEEMRRCGNCDTICDVKPRAGDPRYAQPHA